MFSMNKNPKSDKTHYKTKKKLDIRKLRKYKSLMKQLYERGKIKDNE